ncbi:MAG: hypothetical protein ACK5Q5_23585 [Planctomycetaceae bacterium]
MSSAVVQHQKRRRWIFLLLTLTLSFGVCELISRIGVWIIGGQSWPLTQRSLATSGLDRDEYGEVLHPYLGYCHDPQSSPGYDFTAGHVDTNRLGLSGNLDPVQQRGPERLVIGILGGSFAWNFGFEAADDIRDGLRSDPRFADRDIRIVNLALPGFKQPQQVMALNYVLALGGEFDLVLNLDGFNEVALGFENWGARVAAAYPKGWPIRVHDVPDNRRLTESYEVFALRAKRQAIARSVVDSPSRGLALRQVWWKLQDQSLEKRLIALCNGIFAAREAEGRPFAVVGPFDAAVNQTEQFQHTVQLWARCSRQLNAVTVAQGGGYIHALQPNQYLPDCKPLSPFELSQAYDLDSDYCLSVTTAYPQLQAAGRELRADGLRFVDLTGVYRNHAETLYIDWCCHVNREGYRILAAALLPEMLSTLVVDTETDSTPDVK